MTQFTKRELLHAYPQLPSNLPVIYPPISLDNFLLTDGPREAAIVSVGRFDAYKGQLEQIQIAAELPALTFHIVGFVANRAYFEKCAAYVEDNQIRNVRLHPQASFEEMASLLQSSRYFLHTTVNEPFGLTAVQAIAAGCIPLVHDSGGQKETVFLERLRYHTLEDVVGIILTLEQEAPSARKRMIEELQAHIQQYDEAVFMQKMRPILEAQLEHKRGG